MNTTATLAMMLQLSLQWAPSVHDGILKRAFAPHSDRELLCLLQLQAGSRYVDDEFQEVEFSYMHAMRGPQDKNSEQAAKRTWDYIKQLYADVRRMPDVLDPEVCHLRGRALHAVMDSTSPAHEGYQEWAPLKHPMQIFDHGEFTQDLIAKLGLQGIVTGAHSLENWIYLDDHPQLLERTVQFTRAVDEVFRMRVGR